MWGQFQIGRTVTGLFIVSTLFSACALEPSGDAIPTAAVEFSSEQQQPLRWSQADRPEIADLNDNFVYTYADLPSQGEAERVPWASDYWPTFRDSINHRWNGNEPSPAEKYAAAFNKPGIDQGVSWEYGIRSQRLADPCSVDDDCEVDNGNTKVCAKQRDAERGVCIENWTGICHAWAPAAILEREPERSVELNGVRFSVTDIKALISLAYDKGSSSVFLGTRCNLDIDDEDGITYDAYGRPETYTDAQGQVVDCKDTNPGSLHVVLANMIGLQGESLVEDRTIDYQVWNQPLRGYEVLSSVEVSAVEANQLIGVFEGGAQNSFSGNINQNEWQHYGPFAVAAGDDVSARMTGTGDADLYVRFGAQPTIAAYDCRPYGSDSTENCELQAPDGHTEVYFAIRAYRPAEGEDNIAFELETNVGSAPPSEYILNPDAETLYQVRTRVDWITEAYALPENDRNLSGSIDDFTRSDTYDYILEVDAAGAIIGGEWLGDSKRDHPDFLWVPIMKAEYEVARPPIELLNVESRAIPEGEWVHFQPVDLSAGDDITVVMTGTGNGDLYLGLDAQPTQGNYACRPTSDDSRETCGGTIPNGYRQLHVSVFGSGADSNINIEVVKQLDGTGVTWSDVRDLLERSITTDPCMADNGGCGDATFTQCVPVDGTPSCLDIDECAVDNGGCGDAAFTLCTNEVSAAPTCSDIDECANNNGGCGDAAFTLCTNEVSAAPTCSDIDECANNYGGCGDPSAFTCLNRVGEAPLCERNLDVPVLGTEVLCQLYALDMTHGFSWDGDYQANWGARGEKWMRDGLGASVYVLPNGELYRWDGESMPLAGELITQVNAAVYMEPSLLHAAEDQNGSCDAPESEPSLTVARRAFRMDDTLQFSSTGNFATNWGGLGEKWFINGSRNWFYIVPDGTIFRWNGEQPIGGSVVGRLDTDYYGSPELLMNAINPDALGCGGVESAYAAYDVERVLQFKFSGSYAENWGERSERWMVSDANGRWHFILPNGDLYRWRRNSRPADGEFIANLGSDVYNDPRRLHDARLPTAQFCENPFVQDLATVAAELDRTHEFEFVGRYFTNWAGLGEKWIRDGQGRWHYIVPNGDLYLWSNGAKPVDGELIATLSPQFHDNPALLHNAAP